MLRFRPMLNGQGLSATLPDGHVVIQWDQKHFAKKIEKYELLDREGRSLQRSDTLADVVPSIGHHGKLQALGRTLATARQAEAQALEAIKAALPAAVADGVTQVDAAQLTGLDRMTIRKMLGKDPRRGQSAG